MSGRLEVEVVGIELAAGAIAEETVRRLCAAALEAVGAGQGHVAVEFVGSERIRTLNRDHRGRDVATDVLSFPVDEATRVAGPRELGDVLICPAHTTDLGEAVVHGALHLAGMDHESDEGQMLARQRAVLARTRG